MTGDVFDFTGQQMPANPSTYDAAVEALHAAQGLVIPISVDSLPEEIEAQSRAAAFATIAIADELLKWLSEHIEPDLDDDGPRQQPAPLPCPDCRAGKHTNCSGDSWGPRPDTPEGDGPIVCPCPDDSHDPGHANKVG